MARSDRSAATPAITVLQRDGAAFTLHPYEVGAGAPTYGEAVAAAIGVDPRRLFKTLVTTVDDRLAVAVVPVAAALDLKALAAACRGKRAAMAQTAAAERSTGYVTGGISPLGQRSRLPTVVDASADQWPTIYVSAGRRGLQVELSAADLIRLTNATIALISTAS
jgi:Cys-tRNA(Pro)/Cys-tRNA(Cys) deacylase